MRNGSIFCLLLKIDDKMKKKKVYCIFLRYINMMMMFQLNIKSNSFLFLFWFSQLKTSDSGYTINRSNDNLESSAEMLANYEGQENGGGGVHKPIHPGANGSVITMTLKNNHLIVETEERNVRCTKEKIFD